MGSNQGYLLKSFLLYVRRSFFCSSTAVTEVSKPINMQEIKKNFFKVHKVNSELHFYISFSRWLNLAEVFFFNLIPSSIKCGKLPSLNWDETFEEQWFSTFLKDGIKLKAHSESKPPLNCLKLLSESVYSQLCLLW